MRLPWNDYLAAVRADGERLAAAAAGHLDDPVPWCPGWVGRDVVAHTGSVHHRITAIVADRLTERPHLEERPAPGDADLISRYRQGLDELLDTLTATDPATPLYTWHRADQSAGFWIRRMAHETAIHRADAESASGAVTPLAPALGADGADEVLGPIMCAYTDDPYWEFTADGRTAQLVMSDTGDVRHLAFGTGKHGTGWIYSEGSTTDPIAVITAAASDLDLWAWGRADDSALTVEGDANAVTEIRALAAAATG